MKSSIKDKKTLKGHTDWIKSIDVSLDSIWFASGSSDKTVMVWDTNRCKPLETLGGHTDWVNSVAIFPNSNFIASASNDKTIKIWDIRSAAALNSIKGGVYERGDVAVSSDNNLILFGSNEDLDNASSAKVISIYDIRSGEVVQSLGKHDRSIQSVAMFSDDRFVISSSYDETIKIWDMKTGNLLKSLSELYALSSMAISPNGEFIVHGSSDGSISINYYNKTDNIVKNLAKPGGESTTSLDVSSDSKHIVSGSCNNMVKIWDAESDESLDTLEGHTACVNTVAMFPNNKYIASGSGDNTIIISEWDIDRADDYVLPLGEI